MSYHEEIPQHFVIDEELWKSLEAADAEMVCRNCSVAFDEAKLCLCLARWETHERFKNDKLIHIIKRNDTPLLYIFRLDS